MTQPSDKNPQNPENETPSNPQDNSGLDPVSADNTDEVDPLEEEFFRMMMEDSAPDTIESLTAQQAEIKDGISQLQAIYANAEAANAKANEKLDAIRKEASDAIAKIQAEARAQTKEAINAFVADVSTFVAAYEATINDIPADARADQRFDKIAANFEVNLKTLKNAFNKFTQKDEQAVAADAENTAETATSPTSETAETVVATVPTGEVTIASLQAENAELEAERAKLIQSIEKKQLNTQSANLQATALQKEIENSIEIEKRQQNNKIPYAITPVIKELLPVIDTYETGAKAYSDDAATDTPLAALLGKLKENFDTLGSIFNAHGVKAIEPKPHDDFNEEKHVAWKSEPMDGFDDGVVTSMQRKGYMLNERVVRPAAVFTTPE